LRHFFFCTIFIYFWFVPFFGSNFAFAEVQDYAHAIVTTSTGKKISVEVADTVEKRSLGLGKRSGLENGWGMLFVFEKRKQHGFWMKGMQFPLDIIWLDNHRIASHSPECSAGKVRSYSSGNDTSCGWKFCAGN